MPAGGATYSEILLQPELWPDTFRRVRAAGFERIEAPVLTGAGSSFFAAQAVEPAWPGARAVPSTDLLFDPRRYVAAGGTVVSFARSGDSPESAAVVDKTLAAVPRVRHIALTANPDGRLAKHPAVTAILLDPRTNERGFAMTCSYSNLVVAGLALARAVEIEGAIEELCAGWEERFEKHVERARSLAADPPERVAALASPILMGAAREACLKILELTAGRVVALPETYLGLRHGPLSFLRRDTLVLCFVSSDPAVRRYESDLVRELRAKGLGRLVALGQPGQDSGLYDEVIATSASALPDEFRTPSVVVFPQLLAWHLSVRSGLDPDNPSPGGVINRVVQGVRIYD